MPVGCVGDVGIRVIVWFCMIRSRIPFLQSMIFENICSRGNGYRIGRPYSPIDRVIQVWMEGFLHESKAIKESDSVDSNALPILRNLIELILQESRNVDDYRVFFNLIVNRINVYIEHLMNGVVPTCGVTLGCKF